MVISLIHLDCRTHVAASLNEGNTSTTLRPSDGQAPKMRDKRRCSGTGIGSLHVLQYVCRGRYLESANHSARLGWPGRKQSGRASL